MPIARRLPVDQSASEGVTLVIIDDDRRHGIEIAGMRRIHVIRFVDVGDGPVAVLGIVTIDEASHGRILRMASPCRMLRPSFGTVG